MRFSAAGWARFRRGAFYLIARARCQRIEQSEAAKLRNLSKRRENQFYHTIQNRAAARAFTPWFCVLRASWRVTHFLLWLSDWRCHLRNWIKSHVASNFTLKVKLHNIFKRDENLSRLTIFLMKIFTGNVNIGMNNEVFSSFGIDQIVQNNYLPAKTTK